MNQEIYEFEINSLEQSSMTKSPTSEELTANLHQLTGDH